MKCKKRNCNNDVMTLIVENSHCTFFNWCYDHRPANFWDMR